MGPFWKWMVGFMAWGQLRFIETKTLSSVGHQPSFYEYKVKGDNIDRAWSQNNKKYSSNLANSSIVMPMSLSIIVSSSYYSFIVVSDPPWTLSGAQMCGSFSEAWFKWIHFPFDWLSYCNDFEILFLFGLKLTKIAMVMGPCYMLQRLNGAQIAMQILRKSDHGAAEDARDRKVQGYSHIFTLTIQDTKWYHVLEMMFWQIGTPNKAWWHEVCPRQIQSSFQRRHGSRDFHIWLSLISGLCVDEISYTVTNMMVSIAQVTEFIHLRKNSQLGLLDPRPFLLFQ